MYEESNYDSLGSESEFENFILYQCRQCPGRFFTLEERERHRSFHKNLKNTTVLSIKTRSETQRRSKVPSPPPSSSTVTLFNVIETSSDYSSLSRALETTPETSQETSQSMSICQNDNNRQGLHKLTRGGITKKKIRSQKRFDKTAVVNRKNTGG